MRLGIDFGTTNSAVSALDANGQASLLAFAPGELVQRTVIHCDPRGILSYGNAAFETYVDSDLDGRLLRSLKSFLSEDVPDTTLAGVVYSFTDLVTLYLRYLVREAERVTGETVSSVVMGRPVHFNVDASRDEQALSRLRQAAEAADLPNVSFRLEPVAAAYTYEQGLTSERRVLVGDFGGGTADFAVLRVGPGRSGRGPRDNDVLGTSGVALAGDALDGRFLKAFLLPWFGSKAKFREPYTDDWFPWKHAVQRQIQQLSMLHLLRDPDLERRLQNVQKRMDDPLVVRRLLRLIFDDLGYPLAWAIEATKKDFSLAPEAVFAFREFHEPALDMVQDVDIATFATEASDMLEAYDAAVTEVLDAAQLDTDGIDEVFLTGGTSQTPFVRELFERRFGVDRIASRDALTSVCLGLVAAD